MTYIYLLKPIEVKSIRGVFVNSKFDGYNKMHGCVVYAHSPKEARKVASQHAGEEGADIWLDQTSVSSKMIGGASEQKAKLILRDFLND